MKNIVKNYLTGEDAQSQSIASIIANNYTAMDHIMKRVSNNIRAGHMSAEFGLFISDNAYFGYGDGMPFSLTAIAESLTILGYEVTFSKEGNKLLLHEITPKEYYIMRISWKDKLENE